MITKQVSIVNPTGLHARPATDFVHKAKEFDCRITLRRQTCPRRARQRQIPCQRAGAGRRLRHRSGTYRRGDR